MPEIVRNLRQVFIDFIWRNPRSESEILTILPFLSLSQRIWKVEASRLTQRTKKEKKFYSLKLWTPSWEELLKKKEKKKFVSLRPQFFFLLDELDSDTKYQCANPDSANLLQWWHRPSPSNIIIRGLRANFHKGEYQNWKMISLKTENIFQSSRSILVFLECNRIYCAVRCIETPSEILQLAEQLKGNWY